MNPRLLAALLAASAALALGADEESDEIEDFDYSTVMTAVQAIFGTQQNIGQGIQAMLVKRVAAGRQVHRGRAPQGQRTS